MKFKIRFKGGKGSGHHGHEGIPGHLGGSLPGKGGGSAEKIWDRDVDLSAGSQAAFEDFIKEGFGDDTNIVRIGPRSGGKVYRIITENWFPDCMESRGLGHTDTHSIRQSYLDIMVTEAGWDKADIHGYVPDAEDSEFGITYVGQFVGTSTQ